MLSKVILVSLAVIPAAALAQQTSNPNRFTAAARMSFNISASFSGSGSFPAQTDPGPVVGHGVNRNYDDGYVRVDSEGNAAGLTWYWGYRDASQLPGNDSLLMHSTSAAPTGTSGADADNPQLGFEIAYLRDFSRSLRFAWGLKAAFNFVDIDVRDTRSIAAPGNVLTDTYSLGSIVAPGDPTLPGWQYRGAYGLPGPVIDDVPLGRGSALIPGAATTTGQRTIDAGVFGWHLGPWIEMALFKPLWLTAGGGLSLAYVDSTFNFDETTSVAGAGTVRHTGSDGHADLLVGGYVEAGLNLRLSTSWSVFALADYQFLGEFSQTSAGHQANLDLGDTWSVNLGVGYSF